MEFRDALSILAASCLAGGAILLLTEQWYFGGIMLYAGLTFVVVFIASILWNTYKIGYCKGFIEGFLFILGWIISGLVFLIAMILFFVATFTPASEKSPDILRVTGHTMLLCVTVWNVCVVILRSMKTAWTPYVTLVFVSQALALWFEMYDIVWNEDYRPAVLFMSAGLLFTYPVYMRTRQELKVTEEAPNANP